MSSSSLSLLTSMIVVFLLLFSASALSGVSWPNVKWGVLVLSDESGAGGGLKVVLKSAASAVSLRFWGVPVMGVIGFGFPLLLYPRVGSGMFITYVAFHVLTRFGSREK